jgi:hypothetical protein
MHQAELLKALDLLKQGNLQNGDECEAAHQICQRHEGTALFDWVHALVHRIEGDDGNAAYWYRRAGRSRHPGTVEQEWQAIRQVVEAG